MANALREAELHGTMDFTRQRDFFDPTKTNARVTLIGAGGIGSFTAFALAKLGIPNLRVVDFDMVETHNLPNQMFPLDAVGESKVDAVAGVVEKFTLSDITVTEGMINDAGRIQLTDSSEVGNKPSGVVVSGLDSMEARKNLWKGIKHNIQVPFFVDARLGGQNVVIYTLDPRKPAECERYEETLHTDGEALEESCTARAIIDVGFLVSSLITRCVRKHLSGQKVEHTIWFDQSNLTIMKGIDEN